MALHSRDFSMSSEESGGIPALNARVPRTLANRACSECRRKKSRCQMERPECSLCWRTGAVCVYPTRRAPGRKKKSVSNATAALSTSQEQDSSLQSVIDGTFVNEQIPFEISSLQAVSLSNRWDDSLPPLDLQAFQASGDCFPSPIVNIDFVRTEFDDLCGISWLEEDGLPQRFSRQASGVATLAGPIHDKDPSRKSFAAITPHSQQSAAIAGDQANSSYSIDVSSALALDLTDNFFKHVHFYLPLLHMENFKRQHDDILHSRAEQLCDLPWETAFLLCSIFALSARFSTLTELTDEDPVHRGDRFALQASQLFEMSSAQLENTPLSMSYLQATILLTYHTVQSRPSRQAWLQTGICVRLAYELELHICDADIISGETDVNNLSIEEYSLREERRRAWWVIWDIDTFLSFMALRPSTAGHHNFQVLLPIPDKAWLSGQIVPLTYLEPKHTIPWSKLCDSPNQSAWQWFLAATMIARQVTEMLISPCPSEEFLAEVEGKYACYSLALPESFRIDLEPARLEKEQAQGMNWIISSLLITQSLRALIAVRRKSVNLSRWHRDPSLEDDDSSPPKNALRSKSMNIFTGLRHGIANWIRHWPVESFTQCSPLICACLIGPALSYASEGEKVLETADQLDRQTIIFAIKRLARYWMISKVLLDKLDHMRNGQVNLGTEQTVSEQALRRHWRSTMIW